MLEHYYIHTILDFSESGLKQIPPNTSCTEKPQQWHKPAQRTSNVPVLFKDILMIKHDYDADKQKTEKRIQRKNKKEAYLPYVHPFLNMLRGIR